MPTLAAGLLTLCSNTKCADRKQPTYTWVSDKELRGQRVGSQDCEGPHDS
jgi:hypothetical protein